MYGKHLHTLHKSNLYKYNETTPNFKENIIISKFNTALWIANLFPRDFIRLDEFFRPNLARRHYKTQSRSWIEILNLDDISAITLSEPVQIGAKKKNEPVQNGLKDDHRKSSFLTRLLSMTMLQT